MSDFDTMSRQPLPLEGSPILEPKRIKVFGVLHIVFGAMGLLGGVFSLVAAQFQEFIMKLTPTAPGMDEYTRVALELTRKMSVMSYIGAAMSLVLGVLLLKAGIELVKRRKKGLRSSKLYAYTSLALKAVALILFFVLTKPLMDGLLDPVLATADGILKTQLNILKITQAVAGVLSPFLMSIYPILTLVMLNKAAVKDFMEVHGQ